MPSYYSRGRSAAYSRRPRYGSSRPARSSKGGRVETINPERFVRAATLVEEKPYEPHNSFADFALAPQLLSNLQRKGYQQPSPIQDQSIPPALEGRDIIGIASTGTGKTAAFALPILQKLLEDPSAKGLIIAPTRELAMQIETECKDLSGGKIFSSALLIGGMGIDRQLQALRRRPRLIIGTPGRIRDHIQRKSLKLHDCSIIVLDEVDRMLDMGFVNDVTSILEHVNPQRQSFFFSATIDARVRRLIDTFTQDPVTITLQASSASENVHQDVIRYGSSTEKFEKLVELLEQPEVKKVIVFEETQRAVDHLQRSLKHRDVTAEIIHGGKSQSQRHRALKAFKHNDVDVLVATDVAARGIDVADVTHVVNYSVPRVYDDYIHRIGRAGRAGKIGHAYTFVSGR